MSNRSRPLAVWILHDYADGPSQGEGNCVSLQKTWPLMEKEDPF